MWSKLSLNGGWLVSEVFVKSLEHTTYTIDSDQYEAYNINVEWVYEKDLGYDTNANIVLIKNDNSISVVEEKRVEVME